MIQLEEISPVAHTFSELNPLSSNVTEKQETIGPESATHSRLQALRNALFSAQATHRDANRLDSVRTRENLRHLSLCRSKRVTDVLLALLGLIVAGPLLLTCAAIIWLSSGRPILFQQQRLGRGGRHFGILKFRTMVPNAESVLIRYLEQHPQARLEWEQTHKLANDPRILPIGRFLRRFSLDELPQLVNVLRGEMSMVGPRAIVEAEVKHYKDEFVEYCKVRPGLTGLWQVCGRSDTSYEQRTTLDREYIESWSLLTDLKIVVRTVSVVLQGSGAY